MNNSKNNLIPVETCEPPSELASDIPQENPPVPEDTHSVFPEDGVPEAIDESYTLGNPSTKTVRAVQNAADARARKRSVPHRGFSKLKPPRVVTTSTIALSGSQRSSHAQRSLLRRVRAEQQEYK